MRRLLLSFSLCCAGACGRDDPAALEPPLPLALDGALAYLDAANASVVIVDPDGAAGAGGDRKLARVAAGETPVLARSVRHPDDARRHRVLVVDPGAEQLLIIEDRIGTTRALSTGLPLEALDVSADGRWAIVYQPDGAEPRRGLFAFPNTVAVADLDPEAPRATPLRLGSAGARPLRASFSRSVRLSTQVASDGEVRNVTMQVPLALMFVRGGIVPVSLERVEAGPLLPLAPGADRDVLPAEVLFTDNGGDTLAGQLDNVERAFVRSTAGELYVLSLSLAAGGLGAGEDGIGVLVALENVVTPDATVHDVELFFDEGGTELLLAAAGDEVILVDGYTGVASRFPAPTRVDKLVRFEDPQTGQPLALGYAGAADPQPELLRLDPLGLDGRRATGMTLVRLSTPVESVDVAAGSRRAVLAYEDGRELGVLDLSRSGEVLDLRFARRLAARALSAAGDRLWLVSDSPEDEAPHLAEVDLDSLQGRDVQLDAGGTKVGRAGRFLWVDHGDPTGAVTFFPDDDLTREAAVALRGVLLTDLLSLKTPDRR